MASALASLFPSPLVAWCRICQMTAQFLIPDVRYYRESGHLPQWRALVKSFNAVVSSPFCQMCPHSRVRWTQRNPSSPPPVMFRMCSLDSFGTWMRCFSLSAHMRTSMWCWRFNKWIYMYFNQRIVSYRICWATCKSFHTLCGVRQPPWSLLLEQERSTPTKILCWTYWQDVTYYTFLIRLGFKRAPIFTRGSFLAGGCS